MPSPTHASARLRLSAELCSDNIGLIGVRLGAKAAMLLLLALGFSPILIPIFRLAGSMAKNGVVDPADIAGQIDAEALGHEMLPWIGATLLSLLVFGSIGMAIDYWFRSAILGRLAERVTGDAATPFAGNAKHLFWRILGTNVLLHLVVMTLGTVAIVAALLSGGEALEDPSRIGSILVPFLAVAALAIAPPYVLLRQTEAMIAVGDLGIGAALALAFQRLRTTAGFGVGLVVVLVAGLLATLSLAFNAVVGKVEPGCAVMAIQLFVMLIQALLWSAWDVWSAAAFVVSARAESTRSSAEIVPAAPAAAVSPAAAASATPALHPSISREARVLVPSPIRRLSRYVGNPDYVSFASGAPSPETFPSADLAAIAAELIGSDGARVLQYGPTHGVTELREAVADRLARRSLPRSADDLIITAGSQQGLDLVARVLFDPGDVLLVERPSYTGALAAFRARRVEFVGIPGTSARWDLTALADRIAALRADGRKVKAIYTIPNFQNPAGGVLEPAQRTEIAAFVATHDLWLLEDDPYGELRFGDVDTTPIAVAADPERTVYFGSFSKILAPGLRSAYIAAGGPVRERVALLKQAADLCSSTLDHAIVAEYCRRGLLDEQIRRACEHYRVRRDAMLEELATVLPTGSTFTRTEGGLFTWVELPPGGPSADELLERALTELKITFVPGSGFYVDGSGARTLRLTFAQETVERIRDGIRRLGPLLAEGTGA